MESWCICGGKSGDNCLLCSGTGEMHENTNLTAHMFFEKLRTIGLLRGGWDTIRFASDFSSCLIGKRRDTAEEEYDYYPCKVPEDCEEFEKVVKDLKLKVARKVIENVGS